jgi:short-subunit dehydrogenase
VDIWINNVGISHPLQKVWELPKGTVDSVVATNLIGTLYGSQVAIRGMLVQGEGHLYNMEGLGSDGQVRSGLSVYGASKAAVTYLTKALAKETEKTPVKVSRLSPGVVITELATGPFKENPERLERAKRIYNIIGDKVETVTPWMADKILENDKSGAHIAWLTPPKVAWRFITAGLQKRDLFSSEGT